MFPMFLLVDQLPFHNIISLTGDMPVGHLVHKALRAVKRRVDIEFMGIIYG